jgi:hypothetical protein
MRYERREEGSNQHNRRIAVGTPIARRPPHGPGRAAFPHPVLTLDEWRRSARQERDAESERREPIAHTAA